MKPQPKPDDRSPGSPGRGWLDDSDEDLLRDVPLEVVQRLGGAFTPAEMDATLRGAEEMLARHRLRVSLESARLSLNKGQTKKALQELEEVQYLLKRVGGAGEAREASELKKDVERSLVARSISPDNAFRVFAEVNRIIHSATGMTERIELVLARIADAVNADRAFMAIHEPEHAGLGVAATRGLPLETARGLLAGIQAGERDLILRGRPVISVGVEHDERFRLDHGLGRINSLIMVPCGAEDESSGVVYFDRLAETGRPSFDQTDLDLVAALTSSLAVLAVEAHLGLEVRANVDLRRQLTEKYAWQNVVTSNKELMEILRVLERISPSSMTVLLQGETGTGKQLIAQAIHHHSPRRDRPFVTIDCAALSAQLLESELFGHLRGAFTGATSDRRGLFEEAHSGTVFLDEIDKTTHDLQRRLLHVVDQAEVRPLGAQEYRKVDVRLIVATSHPNLRRLVDEGLFIKDLFFRLNDIAITLPPLRNRKEDMTLLVEHFLRKHGRELGKLQPRGVSRPAMQLLLDHDWPGNVRELEKVLRRAAVLAEPGAEIQVEDLPPEIRSGEGDARATRHGTATSPPSSNPAARNLGEQVEELEKRAILGALNGCGWNKSRVARELGLTRKGLRMKIERYGLEEPRD